MATNSLTTIEKKLNPALEAAESLVIKDAKGMEKATEMLSAANKYLDSAEEEKMKVMRPLLDATAAERKRWKPIEELGGKVVDIIRKKMTAYQTKAKRIADEEAAKLAARVGKGKGKLKAETAIAKMDEIEKPEEKVMTTAGSVKFRTVPCFEVEDLKKLPLDYHLANETMIRKAMENGEKLPGVRYWTEERPVNSR